MENLLKVVALSMIVVIGTSSSDHLCGYSGRSSTLDCSNQGLTLPPPGYWPRITNLTLENNRIAALPKGSLSGFPNLTYLDIDINFLRKFDFGELTTMPHLQQLSFQSNQIVNFISPPTGVKLDKLRDIYSNKNHIWKLDPNFFLFAPNMQLLAINFNPLEVPADKPVLNHPSLKILFVGIGSRSFNVMTEDHLSGLPKLRWVTVRQAQVTNVTGAFVNNKLLKRIDLGMNKIARIYSGTFASDGALQTLILDGNPLKRFDTAAVNKRMADGATINISDTPLACGCGFDALFWWGSGKNITLNTTCKGLDMCSYARSLRGPASPPSHQKASQQAGADLLGFYETNKTST